MYDPFRNDVTLTCKTHTVFVLSVIFCKNQFCYLHLITLLDLLSKAVVHVYKVLTETNLRFSSTLCQRTFARSLILFSIVYGYILIIWHCYYSTAGVKDNRSGVRALSREMFYK